MCSDIENIRIWGRYPDLPGAKYLGQIGFTMIQMAYQVHKKLYASLLQQKHSHEPSPLTSASNQNTHTRTSGCHYNASHPVGLGGNMRPVGLGGNTIHGKQVVPGAAMQMTSLGES